MIIDDASTDNSAAILETYAAKDSRIRTFRNEIRQGLPASLNRCLTLCYGDLIARADADDTYEPTRLAKQFAHMEAHPHLGVLSCGFHKVDHQGQRLRTVVPLTGHENIRFRMLFENCLLHPGVMYRAELVRKVGGYDPKYCTAQDSDLWARLLPLTRIDNLVEPLVCYRIHIQSVMQTRGLKGRKTSLSVPRRQLNAYLGYDPGEQRTRRMVELFQSYRRMSLGPILAGEKGLRLVRRVVCRKESPQIRDAFKASVSASLLKQSNWLRPRDANAAVALCLRALMWKPSAATLKRLCASDTHTRIAQFNNHRPKRGPFRCDLHPCPSRDGRKILVTSLDDGGRQLYVLNR